jgi:hypothetical protein
MQIYCSSLALFVTSHLQNVIGGTGLDMLTSTPPGVSGPLSRDIGYVFEAAFVHRKDVGAEIAAFIRTFAKREPKFKSQITAATQNLKQATTVFENCKARSESFEKVTSHCKPCASIAETFLHLRFIRLLRGQLTLDRFMRPSRSRARACRPCSNASCDARLRGRRPDRSGSRLLPPRGRNSSARSIARERRLLPSPTLPGFYFPIRTPAE